MPNRETISGFVYRRTIRFHETDAAGVVYFANSLILCHEAYEAALAAAGIDVRLFFGGRTVAVPIVHASVDFRRPLFCGESVAIALTPHRLDDTSFEIRYHLSNPGPATSEPATSEIKTVATALTRHVCIDSTSRQRHPLTPELVHWLTAATEPPGTD